MYNLKLLNEKFPIKSKFYYGSDMVRVEGVDYKNSDLDTICTYLKFISFNYWNYKYAVLPEFILNDIRYFKRNNLFAIYLILILFKYVQELQLNMDDLKLYQGLVTYERFEDFSYSDCIVNEVYHPFLTYKGAIIDFAINSECVMLPIQFKGYVCGQAPYYICYCGIKENLNILFEYYNIIFKDIKLINIDINVNINNWYNNHSNYMRNLSLLNIL